MVGIVIVCHGDMADGLVDAARMIVGEQAGIVTVSLRETDAVGGLMERVSAAVKEVDTGEGALALVDLFGASPYNASARLAVQGDGKMEVITGVSLPMLLEVMVQRDGKSFEQLVDTALDAGASGVRTLSQTLGGKTAS